MSIKKYHLLSVVMFVIFVIQPTFPILSVASTVELAKTGQTVSHYPGDDGDIQAGVDWPDPRFTDNGDGTITDTLTGLIWLKDMNCFGTMHWGDGLAAIANLNSNPDNYSCDGYTGNYTDWRFPNVNEFESLINAETYRTTYWLYEQGFVNPLSYGHYWSSTTYAGTTAVNDYAWGPGISKTGGVTFNSKSSIYYLNWAVRGGQSGAFPAKVWKTGQTTCYGNNEIKIDCEGTGQDGETQAGVKWPDPRFTDNGDGTVADNLTGLMWLKDMGCFDKKTWYQALDTIADFNTNQETFICEEYTGKYTDWHLPNRKELYSLIDRSQYNPPLPSGHPFANIQMYHYWSSTTEGGAASRAMLMHMPSGALVNRNKYSHNAYFFPVRVAQKRPETTVDITVKKLKINLAESVFQIKGSFDIDDTDFGNLLLNPQARLLLELQTGGSKNDPEYGIVGEDQVQLESDKKGNKLSYVWPVPIQDGVGSTVVMEIEKMKIDFRKGTYKINGFIDTGDPYFDFLTIKPQARLLIMLQTGGTVEGPEFGIVGENQILLTLDD